MNELVMLDVNLIEEHPDNPRKEIGDIDELVESVKANGILQNLTVVPGHRMDDNEWKELHEKYKGNPTEELRTVLNSGKSPDGYTVIIGHRRLNAAKRAGLDKVPCVIKEMTEQEQVKTMLMENMQRTDLTIYEQAKGFQMMMDLGGTVKELAKDSGFSEKTINHRLNMAKLKDENLKKASDTQMKISDLIKLEQLKDVEKRNEIIEKYAGTGNFEYYLSDAIKSEKFEELRKVWLEKLEEIGAERIKTFDYGKYQYLKDLTKYSQNEFPELPEGQIFYMIQEWNGAITIYTLKDEYDPAKKEEQDKKKAEEYEKKKRIEEYNREIEQLFDEMEILHCKYIRELTHAIEYENEIVNFVIDALEYSCAVNNRVLAKVLGIDEEYIDVALSGHTNLKKILIVAYSGYTDYDCLSTNWGQYGRYFIYDEDDSEYKRKMEFLKSIGYKTNEIEEALMNGTHELYKKCSGEEQ